MSAQKHVARKNFTGHLCQNLDLHSIASTKFPTTACMKVVSGSRVVSNNQPPTTNNQPKLRRSSWSTVFVDADPPAGLDKDGRPKRVDKETTSKTQKLRRSSWSTVFVDADPGQDSTRMADQDGRQRNNVQDAETSSLLLVNSLCRCRPPGRTRQGWPTKTVDKERA
jgi:hypothetical protein